MPIALVKSMRYQCYQCGGDLWMLPEGIPSAEPHRDQTVELSSCLAPVQNKRTSTPFTIHVDGLSTRAIVRRESCAASVADRLSLILQGYELRYHSSITRRDFGVLLAKRPTVVQLLLDSVPSAMPNDPSSLGDVVRHEAVMLYLQTTEAVARCSVEGHPRLEFYVTVLRYNSTKGLYEYAKMHHDDGILSLALCGPE